MLRMDISTLKRSELRSLLKAARGRGQDDLADQLEAELSARAEDRPVVAAEPRSWALESDEVLPMEVPEPDLYFDAPPVDRPRKPRWPLALAAVGLLGGGVALGWGLKPVEPAAPSTTSWSPSPMDGGGLKAAPPPSPTPPPPAGEEGHEVVKGAAQAARPPPADPDVDTKILAKAEPRPERPTRIDPCAAPPSPADRLLCGDLALNLLDHEMRDAYGRAMEAGADPVALRESQAAWRRARDPVSDPRALAEVYDRRIRELKALAN